jgi:hypothetical protein
MHYSAYVNAQKFYEKYCTENIRNKKITDITKLISEVKHNTLEFL